MQLVSILALLSGRVLAGEPVSLEQLEEERWLSHLDATDYARSPYTSVAQLPASIEVEMPYQAFNDYYYFALVNGKIYYKPRHKRPAGEKEWVTDFEWKPFGLNEGLPYQLARSDFDEVDPTFADGARRGFISDRLFETATEDQASTFVSKEDWDKAGVWTQDSAVVFDQEFPTVTEIIAITADADEIAVLSSDRQMFYRRKYANIFVSTEWYQGWGQAKEQQVFFPSHLTGHKGWSLGRITATGVGYKEGPDGRIFEWGPAAVSMETMVWLSPDGHKIYYLDSGTPPEVVHFVEAPYRGQYKGEAINSSASTIMLIDRFGAVQTKIADFDLLGSTPTHPYCYFEECDDEVYYPPGDIRSGMSDIRLPAEGWLVHSPVLPPEAWTEDTWISTRITILQTGKGNEEREMRIVGMQEGVMGYYWKKLHDPWWDFREASQGDLGFANIQPEEILQLSDVQQYDGVENLASLHEPEKKHDKMLQGYLHIGGKEEISVTIDDFNREASPWMVNLNVQGKVVPLELHVVQAWNPYMPPHAAKESDDVHTYEGTFGYDRKEAEQALGEVATSAIGQDVRDLLDEAKNKKFIFIVNTTEHGLTIESKARRHVGAFDLVAIDPTIVESFPENRKETHAVFWEQLNDQMEWQQRADALQQSKPSTCDERWAAEVFFFEQNITDTIKGIKAVQREASRFRFFTFGTSGFLYVTQMKTLDAILDSSREWRSDTVRPNELRFNVINGVTSRIPYLAGNIARVQRERATRAAMEAKAVSSTLKPLLKEASQMKQCDP